MQPSIIWTSCRCWFTHHDFPSARVERLAAGFYSRLILDISKSGGTILAMSGGGMFT